MSKIYKVMQNSNLMAVTTHEGNAYSVARELKAAIVVESKESITIPDSRLIRVTCTANNSFFTARPGETILAAIVPNDRKAYTAARKAMRKLYKGWEMA